MKSNQILKRSVCVCLLLLLASSVDGKIVPRGNFGIKEVSDSSDMLPSDGDAWTENNNATYAWTHHPTHADNTANWTTESKVGTYAFNVTHMDIETSMAFFLEVNGGNLLGATQYNILVFWIKLTKSGWGADLFVYLATDRSVSWYAYDRFKFDIYMPREGVWFKVALPLKAFIDMDYVLGEELEPYTFRYLHFMMTGLSSQDNAEILIDGLHFSNFDYYDATNQLDYKLLPNLMALILSETKTAVYEGTTYLSEYAMRALNGSHQYESLESEVLGQILYAGSMIYNKTGWAWWYDNYLTKWANWLIQMQYDNETSIGDGAIWSYYNNASRQFSDIAGATYLGWELGGLSAFYDINGSATIKDTIEKLRGFLIDHLWDSTNEWFDSQFKRSTNSIIDETSWAPMPQGAMATGLGAYLRFVSSNSTVENVLHQLLSKGLTTLTRNEFYIGTSAAHEDNMYVRHGLYQAYEATGNTTYYNHFLNTSKIQFALNHLSTNGSMYQQLQFYGEGGRNAHFDGWGMACMLPLLMWQYDLQRDQNIINLVEQILFDTYLNSWGTSDHGFRRCFGGGAGDWTNQQYIIGNAFIVLGLLEYFDLNPINHPYVAATNVRAGITSHSWLNNKLTFTVNASSGVTSTTKVCCGIRGEPIAIYQVNGTLTWSYNASTTMLNLNVTHASPTRILIYWRTPGDVNDDGIVDIFDIGYISAHWYPGPPVGPLGYDVNADINGDGAADISDIGITSACWGQSV